MKIYTRTGDSGQTGLIGGERVAKDHPRVAAYGAVDETNSCVGAALSVLPKRPAFAAFRADLARIQGELFSIGAILAAPGGKSPGARLDPGAAARLEAEIDRMDAELEPLKTFILPGGSPAGAALHVARSACRRAERAAVSLGKGEAPEAALVYLNRLSDHLFTAARWVNRKLKVRETPWKGSA
ncbi:MAG TPA: cob(I)yrinic acid a,c-diamide adenosyltransferase [Elusimicrobiota bacterium]|jgi:cob(I)alamin adenosyltransferase|nr:cob(I)yrinic acid a,c-diamide adenosyltransferase [Elusimicrobiota bacterium]